jgi:hypothetical protein
LQQWHNILSLYFYGKHILMTHEVPKHMILLRKKEHLFFQ